MDPYPHCHSSCGVPLHGKLEAMEGSREGGGETNPVHLLSTRDYSYLMGGIYPI